MEVSSLFFRGVNMNNQTKLTIDFNQKLADVEDFDLKVLQIAKLARKAICRVHAYETPIEGFSVRVAKNKQVTITVL
ncbi:hypothetical protein NVP1239O_46 [Vibrio phage 1.239.O._10N.261.52.F6]|nr:hypothetical protein NVP1239O_46 [Vibrio phage 1.239.O._10N.261.52.F6]